MDYEVEYYRLRSRLNVAKVETTAIVMSAIAYVERWHLDHGTAMPDDVRVYITADVVDKINRVIG